MKVLSCDWIDQPGCVPTQAVFLWESLPGGLATNWLCLHPNFWDWAAVTPVGRCAATWPRRWLRRTEIKYSVPGVRTQGTPTRTLWPVHSPLKLGSLGLRLMLQKWPGLKLISNYSKAAGYKVNIQVSHFPKNKRNLELKTQSQFILAPPKWNRYKSNKILYVQDLYEENYKTPTDKIKELN